MKKLSECMILIVNSSESDTDTLAELLDETYDVYIAFDGEAALALAQEKVPDLIILNMVLDDMSGIEACDRLKSINHTSGIPVIFTMEQTDHGARTRLFEHGAVDYIPMPFAASEVRNKVQTHLNLRLSRNELSMQNAILEEKIRERTKELELAQETTIEAVASLAEYRNPETMGHIKRVKAYIKALAHELQKNPKYSDSLDEMVIELMSNSSPLHDIGKIGIRDEVLLKEGLLTDEEYNEMKLHTVIGHNALYIASKKLGENSFLKFAMELSKYHQEKWDGSGYPDGLIGELIPLSSRIMALADVYDALISKRPYKPPYTHQKAIEMIVANKGTHFDPEIVDAFLKVEDKFREIALKHSDFTEAMTF